MKVAFLQMILVNRTLTGNSITANNNMFFQIHSASTKFQDWHYKKYMLERNYTFVLQFSTYIPSNCTHRFAWSYSFWMPLQKSSFAMVFNVLVTAFWISEIKSKGRPFKWDFTFWRGTKSNQQVLNLVNTEGGQAQSLFVGPKTA